MKGKNKIRNNSSGVFPDFLIIGTQKGGSTSLYNYLIKHPDILPPSKKELHFFNKTEHYRKGIDWYKKQFPLSKSLNKMTGEATPNYLFDTLTPKRVADHLPQTTKFIVLLRNPVDRAYSNYQMKVKKGHDHRSFEEAIIQDESRLKSEFQQVIRKYQNKKPNHLIYPYITRGIYVEQLKTWMDLFPKHQFLIVKSEELFNEPQKVVNQVARFLGLSENKLSMKMFKTFNKGKYSKKMDQKTRNILLDYYRPYNRCLEEYLDMTFNWDH
ncbi:sulfotransferase domain-containing protein [Priestia aryabhattai]|uniref:sulfotransferase domain-containing protein n=1 Tax=Priestia TaxID=2800373 RepID=UPI0034577C45